MAKPYKWYRYSTKIKITEKPIFKFRSSERYKGIGRPRKSDYDYLTLNEVLNTHKLKMEHDFNMAFAV